MTIDEYWARIKRIPIHIERDTLDGEAILGRNRLGDPCRVDKPDRHDSSERERLIEFYESLYGAATH